MPDITLPAPGQTAWAVPLNGAINAINAAFDTQNAALPEQINDNVAALLQAGANISLAYDDEAGTLTIASTGGGSNLPSDHGISAAGQRVPVASAPGAWLANGLVITQAATASALVQRISGGRITTATPTADTDAVTKLYVDTAVSSTTAGNVYTIDYTGGAYPLRDAVYGTLPANAVVIWRGPVAPTAGSGYALDKDQWSVKDA